LVSTASKTKVVLTGKWGDGPGEFAAVGRREREQLGFGAHLFSLAVGCDDSIYILDPFNNRIQKFASNGTHVGDIRVDGCVDDATGESCVRATRLPTGGSRFDVREELFQPAHPIKHGVNITLDPQNTLYYYCVGQDSAEVWKFRNDALVAKSTAPISGGARAGSGLVAEGDRVWLFDIRDHSAGNLHYDLVTHKAYSAESLQKWRKANKKAASPRCSPTEKRRQLKLEETENGLEVIRK